MRFRMPDLHALAAQPTPRSDEAAGHIARRIAPAWGFAVYGVPYAFFAVMVGTAIAIAIALPLGALLHVSKPVLGPISEGLMGVGFVVAWWPYVRWVRRRRAAARELGRTGVLVTGTVATHAGDRAVQLALSLIRMGIKWSRVTFEHEGTEHRLLVAFARQPPNGTRCDLVFAPGAPYALVIQGRGIPCRVRTS